MYDKQTEDRALEQLYRDIEQWQEPKPKPRHPQGTFSVLLLIAGAFLVLAAVATLSGCNTVAGMAADVEAAARGTQEYLAEPRDGYTGR